MFVFCVYVDSGSSLRAHDPLASLASHIEAISDEIMQKQQLRLVSSTKLAHALIL